MPYGDLTLIGELGLSLSGGQKARVNVARYVILYYICDKFFLKNPARRNR